MMQQSTSASPSAATPARTPAGGGRRVVVERLQPAIDAGRFAIKRTPGETVTITVDMFADGHDLIAGVLKYRPAPAGRPAAGPAPQVEGTTSSRGPGSDRSAAGAAPQLQGATSSRGPGSDRPATGAAPQLQGATRSHGPGSAALSASADPTSAVTIGSDGWFEVPLTPLGNDAWTASFTVTGLGEYEYTVEGWIDRFGTWLKGLTAKHEAGQDVASELLEGAQLAEEAAQAGGGSPGRPDESDRLLEAADVLRGGRPQAERVAAARDPQFGARMHARPDRSASTAYEPVLRVIVDPVRARFGAWYEMFPRSCTPDPGRSGTFREAEARLPDIAAMGFDVLYLPPVHPIGRTHRKGRNNSLTCAPGDPGSPWAIGADAGGHTAIEPGLGTLDDFDRFVETASHLGLQIALDIAFQASPDHPWVRAHPEWFKHRPDGTIKYAENPPKKYQDIYPLDFESRDWPGLWQALRDVFLFWIGHGVTIFRVDNPHTKSFRFWEWCIADIRRDHPEAIFLA